METHKRRILQYQFDFGIFGKKNDRGYPVICFRTGGRSGILRGPGGGGDTAEIMMVVTMEKTDR